MAEEAKEILWVDDEIDQLKSHIIFLEQKGYKITPISNGEDAVDLVSKKGFDLVLLDEMMPGKDGLTALEEIKQVNPHLPIIMVTKSEEEDLMNQAIGKKIDDYLTKPVNPSQILSSVKKILETRKIRKKQLTKDYVESFNRIGGLLNENLNWQTWIEIHSQLSAWDLEITNLSDPALLSSHLGQKKECDLLFGKFIEKNYPLWVKGKNPPPLSVDIIKKHLLPLLSKGRPVYFVVVDCMRLDQWLVFELILSEFFDISREYYYSILPTATPYSRNAIFSGLFPKDLSSIYPELWKSRADDESSLNRYERQLLDNQLKKLGVLFKTEARYAKILDVAEGENLARRIGSYKDVPLFSMVFNFLDILSHGRSESEILKEIAPDETAFRSLMRSWFIHSHLFEILRYLSAQDCSIIITSDHGSILSARDTVAYGKKDTSTNLRYKYGNNLSCDTSQAVLIKNPEDYALPSYGLSTTYIIAKEDFYFVYPTKYSEYRRQYQNSFQHGGISLEEMILPVARLKPKR
jgi:DNA-binding response OmpR family regulator